MLTLTTGATEVIGSILTATEMPDGAGIRIASAAAGSNSASPSLGILEVTVAAEPEVTDEVIDQEGARVFLEDTVAHFLDDKLLDAEVVDERVQFTLADR